MNTSKQVNVMIGLMFILVISLALYFIWDPIRAEDATIRQEEKAAERGARLFAVNCRICHGYEGKGALEEPPGDIPFPGMILNTPQRRPQDPIKLKELRDRFTYTIMCGRVGTLMPAWHQSQGGPYNDEQIRQLVVFITTSLGATTDEKGEPTTKFWEEAKRIAHEQDEIAGGAPPVPDPTDPVNINRGACGQRLVGGLPGATPTPQGTPVATPTPGPGQP